MQAPKTRAEEITIERIMGWIPQYFQADAFSSETVRQGRELRLFQAAAVRRRNSKSNDAKFCTPCGRGSRQLALRIPHSFNREQLD